MSNNNFKFWYWSNSKSSIFTYYWYWTCWKKKCLIEFNNSKSLRCKVIIKQGSTVQPIAAVLDLKIDILKQPSASTKPVTHQGFKVGVLETICLLVLQSIVGVVRLLHFVCEL